MKRKLIISSGCLLLTLNSATALAQCSICTKTAQQLGDGPAQGMNTGILYLAFLPFPIIGIIAYRWWRNNQQVEKDDSAKEY